MYELWGGGSQQILVCEPQKSDYFLAIRAKKRTFLVSFRVKKNGSNKNFKSREKRNLTFLDI